ncbi:very short patch repair endonuclease [uncultured Roseobacter sp.]|uniref:very short patch repair endonuclease n=1 Tax=uncultured Roseobacter sp. TaxID=114847 RepID=UPI002601922E|nr:very short patch repair endonuclease [uncultured Roseobacter sp.]
MADVHSKEVRRKNMSRIRARDTRPELIVRRGLHALGFRFRLHDKRLPGKPDLVLPKHHAVIFVHGCFWHGHDCAMFRWPATRPEFWRSKIEGNQQRDARQLAALKQAGWRCALVWECALKGPGRLPAGDVPKTLAAWLTGSERNLSVRGTE